MRERKVKQLIKIRLLLPTITNGELYMVPVVSQAILQNFVINWKIDK